MCQAHVMHELHSILSNTDLGPGLGHPYFTKNMKLIIGINILQELGVLIYPILLIELYYMI